MKTILIHCFLCVLIITGNTTANERTQKHCALLFSAERCHHGNWRTYQTRTWLEFSEDGRTVRFRTQGRMPQDENISQRHATAEQRLPRPRTLQLVIPL